MKIITTLNNFINSYREKRNAKNIKDPSMRFVLAWVPTDDPPEGSVVVRGGNPCLKRMVDPLTDSEKEHPAEQNEGVFICNSLQIESKGCDGTDCPDCYKYVIPIIYLKPGEKFIHCPPKT